MYYNSASATDLVLLALKNGEATVRELQTKLIAVGHRYPLYRLTNLLIDLVKQNKVVWNPNGSFSLAG